MVSEIFNKLNKILEDIIKYPISDPKDLDQYRIKYLGTKNVLKPLFKEMKNITPDERKAFGQAMNNLKTKALERYEEVRQSFEQKNSKKEYSDIDLTSPGIPLPLGSRHPVSIVMNKFIEIFTKIGFTIEEEREIEDDWHNFSAMNTPEDHPARDMQDTFYLQDKPDMLLRTHTSSVQARVMTTSKPPIRIIAPGRVYRNETISARSHCQFHQVEGLYIDKNVSFVDMKQTLLFFAKQMYGQNTKIRLRPSYFPFTEPSAEMDVWLGTATETTKKLTKGTGWLEVLGCGMVDPNVLSNCNIDPEIYSGFAFGIGVERSAMQKYGISDIRLLFENDVRFLHQFHSIS